MKIQLEQKFKGEYYISSFLSAGYQVYHLPNIKWKQWYHGKWEGDKDEEFHEDEFKYSIRLTHSNVEL